MPEKSPEIAPSAPIKFFPAGEPRPAQIKALDFIDRAHRAGYQDIVVEAPTGSGKSFIASAAALWGQTLDNVKGVPGGYVLVNQKLLQDQLAVDLARFRTDMGRAALIKSAVEYACPLHKLCSHGGARECEHRKDGTCAYKVAKAIFLTSPLAVTNYAYFFTERAHVGALRPRRVLCLDECHNLARLMVRQVDVTVSTTTLVRFAGHEAAERLAPQFEKLEKLSQFLDWLQNTYLPAVQEWAEDMKSAADAEKADEKTARLAHQVEQHFLKCKAALERMHADSRDWIFWQEKVRDGLDLTARPLEAAPFFREMVGSAGSLRIYLSAYPGPRHSFCRELGLDPDQVAWVSLGSSFPVESRPVYLTTVGSLAKARQKETLPSALRMLRRILDKHANERGIVHSHSYLLAAAATASLEGTPHAGRLRFPTKADDRESALVEHKKHPNSVLISPSIAEGFDFKDDLARFQVIIKCLDKDTKILTEDGLKSYIELTLRDRVFGLNEIGNIISQPVLAIIKKPNETPLLNFNKGDIVVTPSHRMLVTPKRDKAYKYVKAGPHLVGKDYCVPRVPRGWEGTAYLHNVDLTPWVTDSDLLVLTASKLRSPARRFPYLRWVNCAKSKTSSWRFTGKERIADLTALGPVKFQGTPRSIWSPLQFPAPLFHELVGWFAAEGHVAHERRAVIITQKKPQGVRHLVQLLNALGLYFHNDGGKDFIIRSQLLYRFFSVMVPGRSLMKRLDRSFLTCNNILLRCLMDGLLQGDGSLGHDGSRHYYTSSPRLCWQICEIALKLGYSPSVTERNKEGTATAYVIRFNTRRSTVLRSVEPMSYTGEVFCLTVPEMNFLAFRSGKFFFTGNCPFPSLGDKQVEAKLARDQDWYEAETLKTILQACGRICRSETDHGSTYILDSDAARLLRQHWDELPRWFTRAIVEL